METDTRYLYTCSAHSIQQYIFSDDKLRDIVGASLLVEELSEWLIETSEAIASENTWRTLGKAAGMASIIFDRVEDARQVARIAPVIIHRHAPGLKCSQALVEFSGNAIGSALDEANKRMRAARNIPAITLPEPTGILERARRSGQPAARRVKDNDGETELLAPDALAKRNEFSAGGGTLGLLRDILPEEERHKPEKYLLNRWPQNFEDFTENKEGEYMAVVHADVNNLGHCVKKFLGSLDRTPDLDTAIQRYQQFSIGLAECGRTALRDAVLYLITKVKQNTSLHNLMIPFRPLVAAGDDITFVCHAKYASELTRIILEKMSESAHELFEKLETRDADLHAAAGIAWVKTHYPFTRAYDLCEELCSYTKKSTDRAYSALSFLRVTTSLVEDYNDHRDTRMKNSEGTLLTMSPYALEEGKTSPAISHLERLANTARKLPRGKLRGLIERLQVSPNLAQRDWERLYEVEMAKKGNQEEDRITIEDFYEALQALLKKDETKGPAAPTFTTEDPNDSRNKRTPLFDALEWSTIHHEAEEE